MAPPYSYHKPEVALKKAEELAAVNQPNEALTLLHEILLSKRTRSTPLEILEPLMLKFLELAVDLGKGKIAREGLYQYKNIAQNVSVGTIQVKKYVMNQSIFLNQWNYRLLLGVTWSLRKRSSAKRNRRLTRSI